ncbi:hypothetical protein AJ80_08447 [Polytolypa hystricis UAMH7299]|uniref:Serine protease n=1 Tax=Polytolypa hystricis (strain UAMH7299) TaxID=1447883 RepID=A0A2B7X8B3_POLH7|nr:hypothetical protein AJ80_08447 [Polytolypa hystricis UAMH7299]
MHHLSLVTLLLLSFIFSQSAIAAARTTKSWKAICPVSGTPVLSSDVLDPDHLGSVVKRFWNPDGQEDLDSGETMGFNPKMTIEANYPTTYPWSARNAEQLSRLHPNRTGLYFREHVLNPMMYPWNAIGRVFFKRFRRDRGGWCTGSLVGRNLMLTASHCFPWGYGSSRWMRFVPGFHNDTEPYGSSYVSKCRGVKNTFNVTGIDYIICHLCKPLGDFTGWLGTKWWADDTPYMNRSWHSSGYPIDALQGKGQMLLSDIKLTEVDNHGTQGKELETHVFASPGWSGGPMWDYIDGNPKIVGVCSGGEKDCSEQVGGCTGLENTGNYHDVSAGGKLMTDLVLYGMANWEGRDSRV